MYCLNVFIRLVFEIINVVLWLRDLLGFFSNKFLESDYKN